MYMKIYTMQDEFMGGGWSVAILKEINTDAKNGKYDRFQTLFISWVCLVQFTGNIFDAFI